MVRTKRKCRRKCVLKYETVPKVNNLKDLIQLGKTLKLYRGINNRMLYNIVPHLEKLNKMVGMSSLKESIFYQTIYYLQDMHKNGNEEYLHTMIMGSPGHGKTEIARIIGGLYKAMGILSESGPFVIAHRDDFVAGYLGQTAIKTSRLLNSCIGGILFVDEVYSLGPGESDRDSFSKEAIETVTAFLSEHKNDFCFIGAGYEEDIKKCFFASNKGLERRFQWVHKIEKYRNEELVDIMLKMIQEMKWGICVDKNDIVNIIKDNVDLFKNAGGDIETFLSKCKMIHAKRVFTLDKEHKFVLTKKDIEDTLKIVRQFKLAKEASADSPPQGMYM